MKKFLRYENSFFNLSIMYTFSFEYDANNSKLVMKNLSTNEWRVTMKQDQFNTFMGDFEDFLENPNSFVFDITYYDREAKKELLKEGVDIHRPKFDTYGNKAGYVNKNKTKEV